MTREEALEMLIDNAENGYCDIEEVKLVFSELEQEPCEDAISREAVLKLFATHDGNYLYEAIQDLPSVQPKMR